MEAKSTLHFIEFNAEQKNLICSIINHFGTGQHPLCNERTFDGFTVDYLKEIINSTWFIKASTGMSKKSKTILEEIQAKL